MAARTISVSAQGEASVARDPAVVSFAVSGEKLTGYRATRQIRAPFGIG
jgi:hypothetical protein